MKLIPATTALSLGCLLTLLAASGTAADSRSVASQLPDMGTPADLALSKADEYQIGRMVMRGLRDQNQVLEDAEISDYIQHLGSRLAAQTRADDSDYRYFVVRDPGVNAFALPGGFIGVNSGLILLTDNESELAGVLAHETAHVQQRHIARAIQAQSRASLTSTAAMLAALLIGAAGGGGDAMLGGFAIGQGIALQQTMNFTRSEESEADRVGVSLLADANFNVTGMPTFFEKMARSEGIADRGPLDLLRSHPVNRERIAETRARAAQYRNAAVSESPLYPWMRERLRVVSASSEANMVGYYTRLRDARALTDPERYGEALAQLRQNQPERAATTLRQLTDTHPDVTALYGALGVALQAAGRSAEANAVLERGLQLFPRNIPLTVRYAEALMQDKKARQAHMLLLDLFNAVPPTPAQIRLTALAASAAGDTGDAYYYMSEYHLSGGDLALANQQLELALAAPDLTSVQRQRFLARQEDVRDWLREQQRERPRGAPPNLNTP